jgi:hypothetical protein
MRLFNAHRRVLHRRVLPPGQIQLLENGGDDWRNILKEDIVKFVDDLEATDAPPPQEWVIKQLMGDPGRFFSRPKNVPLELRKQVYLYNFPSLLSIDPGKLIISSPIS